jgi:hypothetical protein
MADNTRKYTGPERAEGLLQQVLRRHGVLGRIAESRAVALWPEAVGETVAATTTAESCERGTLTVATRDSVESHALQSRSRDIMHRLNGLLGDEVVKRIRFKVAGRGDRGPAARVWPSRQPRPGDVTDAELDATTLTDAEEREIDGLVGALGSASVKQQVRRSLERHYRADKVLIARGWRPCPRCGALVPPARGGDLCGVCARLS